MFTISAVAFIRLHSLNAHEDVRIVFLYMVYCVLEIVKTAILLLWENSTSGKNDYIKLVFGGRLRENTAPEFGEEIMYSLYVCT